MEKIDFVIRKIKLKQENIVVLSFDRISVIIILLMHGLCRYIH